MPASKPNTTGTEDPAHVPHGTWDSFAWEPFPMYDGEKSVYFRSNDNKIAYGALRERGTGTLTWPEDEFMYVTKGWIKVQVHGGEGFTLNPGDVMMMRKGQTFTFEMSDDFANIAVFVSDEKVSIV